MNRAYSWIKILSTWCAGLLCALAVGQAAAGAQNTTDDPGYTPLTGYAAGYQSQPCLNGQPGHITPAINCNPYADKRDVWLSGSPAGLPDGTYFFAVLVPGHQPDPNDDTVGNLSSPVDAYTDRTFTVTGGITSYSGPHGFDPRYGGLIQAFDYDDTTNNGGVYILAVCAYDPNAADLSGAPGVNPNNCKYDAFKIIPSNAAGIHACKFNDLDGSGGTAPDPGEPPLAGWKIEGMGLTGGANDIQTPVTGDDGCVDFLVTNLAGPVTLQEIPTQQQQLEWVQTAPSTGVAGVFTVDKTVQPWVVTLVQPLVAGTNYTVYFGNHNVPLTEQKVTVTKSASTALKYLWSITKSVDKTLVQQIGGQATFTYTVKVTHDDGNGGLGYWTVSGTFTIVSTYITDLTNVTITDDPSNSNASCKIAEGNDPSNGVNPLTGVTIKHGVASQVFSYVCQFPLGSAAGTNYVNVTSADLQTTYAQDNEPYDFGANVTDECVTVNDTFAGALGQQCVVDKTKSSETFTYNTYQRTVNVPTNDCKSYDNTATFTTNDTSATGSASKTVKVCGPALTGALTMGFWKGPNGTNLILTYCQNPALANYLKGLGAGSGPFSNAPTTSCKDLNTYIQAIFTGANATNMNIMLKAQMLATALDVWFSGPGWTSTTKSGVKPPSTFLKNNTLGGFKMDTTAVCPMVDNTSGSATCTGNKPSTDAVLSGAVPSSPMSMQALLDFAATITNATFGGPFNGSTSSSVWYAGNRTKQEILKNIFDQFNNQLAFGSF